MYAAEYQTTIKQQLYGKHRSNGDSIHHCSIKDKGFVGNRSERALINTCAAGNALGIVNARLLFVTH